jgi:outer membrane receptor protein involved in Fe transport
MKYLALIPLLFAAPAWGQDSAPENEDIIIPLWLIDDEIFVEGIYDTAKAAVLLPASIDVLSVEDLSAISLVHPAEALNGVAGVNIHRGSGQEHLTAIRSPVLTGGAGAGSFLYLEDGVPLRAAGFANVNGLFEAGTEFASKLEVFKGPGPAFYGSNAVHGLINVQSADVRSPNRIRLMGSDDGLVSAQAAISRGNIRASVSLVSDNGFREDSGFDQQKFQLKYQNDLGPWSVDWLSSFNNLNQETAGFIQGDDAYLDDDIRFTNPNPEAFRDGKSYRTQARFERDLSNGKSLALTPYARRAELRFLRHFVPGQALEKNGHSSVGLQSAYFDNSFNIGADVEYSKGFLFEFQENPSRFSFVQGLHYDYEVESFVGAIYGQKNFDLTDNLTLDIGARAEYTDYKYDNLASDGRSGRFIRVADRSDDFLTITPKASLRYSLDNAMFYLRAARGSRAPQVTDLYSVQLNQVAGEADVETLDSLEAGFKGGIGMFDVELAGFTMWKDNFFFRNANGFNVVNGKTKHSGIELSFTGEVTEWLTLSGDGTLAKNSYNFTETVGSAANNITEGDRVDTAPDTLAHMRATLRPYYKVEAELEWRHVGSYFTNPGNTEKYPGHDIFVLRGRYDVSDEITLFGRVDNLFDKRYADRADFAFGNERYFPGRPRTLFFGVSSEF